MGSPFSESLLREAGAWEYGMRIISNRLIPKVNGIDTPLYLSFDPSERPAEIVRRLEAQAGAWSIKYSCCSRLDFTHDARRGEHSSLGRSICLRTQTREFVVRKLERVLDHAPRHAAKVVFQELIDLSNGQLFHAEIHGDRLELEVLFDTHRFLAISEGPAGFSGESSSPDEIAPEESSVVSGMLSRLRQCARVLGSEFDCKAWSIEGFWRLDGPTMRLLHLRPAPLDRPGLSTSSDRTSRTGRALFESGFVWGCCNRRIFIRNGEVEADGIISLCKAGRDPYDPPTLSRLAGGSTDLVVRTGRLAASRLSHEPWFLPPPEYRTHFCHAWISEDVISRFEGESLRLTSDGDCVRLIDCGEGCEGN